MDPDFFPQAKGKKGKGKKKDDGASNVEPEKVKLFFGRSSWF
jgi:hypothetical protein